MIEAMEVGQTLEFQPHEVLRKTLAYYACTIGKKLGRNYYTQTIRNRNIYQITREA